MTAISHPNVRNRLLRATSADDFALLRPHLEPVPMERGQVLIEPNQPTEHVHFPEQGLGSIIANTAENRRIEVGIYGRDGVSGTAILLGTDRTPHEHLCQLPGSMLRMSSAALKHAIRQSPTLHDLLLRYVQAFQIQTAYTALSNGSYSLEERLARWLLMCLDRVDGNDLALTHEFLGIMLAVRRSSVTLAIQILEGARIIKGRRGLITVLDRAKLEEIAGDSYGVPEAEYERLFGRPGDGSDRSPEPLLRGTGLA